MEKILNHSARYIDFLSAHLGSSWLHQAAFCELTTGQDWFVDFVKGRIAFGDKQYPVHFLGGESESGVWLWGMANPSGFPDLVVKTVESFYEEFIVRGDVPDLIGKRLQTDSLLNGKTIASAAAAALKKNYCWHRCPSERSTAFVLVGGLPRKIFEPASAKKVADAITSLIAQYPLNHPLLVRSILNANCISSEQTKKGASGRFRGGARITVTFDALSRIEKIHTT